MQLKDGRRLRPAVACAKTGGFATLKQHAAEGRIGHDAGPNA